MSYEPAPHSEQLGARSRWMGQAKDLNVGPGGSGALLNMHTITKTNTHRQHTHTETTHTHTHRKHGIVQLRCLCVRRCQRFRSGFQLMLRPCVNTSSRSRVKNPSTCQSKNKKEKERECLCSHACTWTTAAGTGGSESCSTICAGGGDERVDLLGSKNGRLLDVFRRNALSFAKKK